MLVFAKWVTSLTILVFGSKWYRNTYCSPVGAAGAGVLLVETTVVLDFGAGCGAAWVVAGVAMGLAAGVAGPVPGFAAGVGSVFRWVVAGPDDRFAGVGEFCCPKLSELENTTKRDARHTPIRKPMTGTPQVTMTTSPLLTRKARPRC